MRIELGAGYMYIEMYHESEYAPAVGLMLI